LLSDNEIKNAFLNVEVLYLLHTQILQKMKERMSGWTAREDNGSPIGDIIVELIPCLKLYVDYVNKFQDSVDLFNKLIEGNKKVAALIEVSSELRYLSS